MKRELTIAEYSAQIGISKKNIYKKIEQGKIDTVEKKINNRNVLCVIVEEEPEEVKEVNYTEVKAVKEVKENGSENGYIPEKEEVKEVNYPEVKAVKEVNYPEQNIIQSIQTKREKELLEEIERLREKINEKDKVINDYANKFAVMAQQAQEIANKALTTTGNAQLLQAAEKQENRNPEVKEEKVDVVEPKEQGGFLYRLFHSR